MKQTKLTQEQQMRTLFYIYHAQCNNRHIDYTYYNDSQSGLVMSGIVMDGIELSYMLYQGNFEPIFVCQRYCESYGDDVYYFRNYADCLKVWQMDETELTRYADLLRYTKEQLKYIDEINALKHSCENLEHRLAMVKDDCNALRNFINTNALEIFHKPSEQCSEALSHLLNIEIACDLKSDECYTWKPYSNN